MESLYQQMLEWVASIGFKKHPSQTPLEYALISKTHQPAATAEIIDEICSSYVSWRYGGQEPNLELLREKFNKLKTLRNT